MKMEISISSYYHASLIIENLIRGTTSLIFDTNIKN